MDAHGGRPHSDGVMSSRTVTARFLPALGRKRGATTTTEYTAAALLLSFAVAAIVWANSPRRQSYSTFWTMPAGITFGDAHAELTLHEIVNDGLMAFIYLVVGLEVKAEFTIGVLTD